MDNLAASPRGFLDMDLEDVLSALWEMGYRRFEAFTTGKGAGPDPQSNADLYVSLAEKYGMSYSSVHLPVVGEDLDVRAAVESRASLADYREVIDGIGDPRMKDLLEVGHFQMAGIPWEEGYELLKGSVALVHVKDMIGSQPVEFGTGEVDLPKLWATMRDAGYTGDFVIEMETEPREKRLELMG